MKKSKIIYILLVILVVLIIIYVSLFLQTKAVWYDFSKATSNYVITNGEKYIPVKEEISISNISDIGTKDFNKKYMAEDENVNVFSAYYHSKGENSELLNIGDKLKLKGTNGSKEGPINNDYIYWIMRKSYPLASLEEMGVDTEEEAYEAEQLAIWQAELIAFDAKAYSELNLIKSRKNEYGTSKINERVYQAAEKLANMAIQSPNTMYTDAEKYYLYSQSNSEDEVLNENDYVVLDDSQAQISPVDNDGYHTIGPFYYNIDFGHITNLSYSVTDYEGNKISKIKLIKEDGQEITQSGNLKSSDEFYVRVPEGYKEVKFSINVTVRIYDMYKYLDENKNDYFVCCYKDLPVNINYKFSIT